VVKLLLARNGVDPDSEDNDGRTPLLWAAGRGHEAVEKLLLAKDLVDLDSKGRYGQTPLLLAIANGHEATVKLFLAKDAVDPDSKDMFGRSALSLASRRGNSNVVKLLLENYEENGVAIRDEDVNIAIPPAADHPSCVICHICISSIPDIDIHYNCGICSDGDFYICQDCISTGAICLDHSSFAQAGQV
jgi:ankyrin repeat protein